MKASEFKKEELMRAFAALVMQQRLLSGVIMHNSNITDASKDDIKFLIEKLDFYAKSFLIDYSDQDKTIGQLIHDENKVLRVLFGGEE